MYQIKSMHFINLTKKVKLFLPLVPLEHLLKIQIDISGFTCQFSYNKVPYCMLEAKENKLMFFKSYIRK